MQPNPAHPSQPCPSQPCLRRISHPPLLPSAPPSSNPDPDPRALQHRATRSGARLALRVSSGAARPQLPQTVQSVQAGPPSRYASAALRSAPAFVHPHSPHQVRRKGKAKRSPNHDSFPDQRPRPPNAKSQHQQIKCRIRRPFECIPHRTRRRHMRKKPRRLPE